MRKMVILLLACCALAEAAPKKKQKVGEDYKSIIAKAQEATLAQDRATAAKTLVEALEKESRDSVGYRELKKSLKTLTEIFYTEKAQKIFEVGRSLVDTDLPGAIERFNEALTLEPGNFQILRNVAQSYFAKGECRKSLDLTKEAMLANPFSTELFLLRVQSKACLGTVEDFDAEMANPYVEKEAVGIYLDVARAQNMIAAEDYKGAVELLEKARLKDAKFPEFYYWGYQARTKGSLGSGEKDLEIYVSLCKQEPTKVRQKYSLEPRTCREAKLMEQQLETIKAEGT